MSNLHTFDSLSLVTAGNGTIPSGSTTTTVTLPVNASGYDLKVSNTTNGIPLGLSTDGAALTVQLANTTGSITATNVPGAPGFVPNLIVVDYQKKAGTNTTSIEQHVIPTTGYKFVTTANSSNDTTTVGTITFPASTTLSPDTYDVAVTFIYYENVSNANGTTTYATAAYTTYVTYTAIAANTMDIDFAYAVLNPNSEAVLP